MVHACMYYWFRHLYAYFIKLLFSETVTTLLNAHDIIKLTIFQSSRMYTTCGVLTDEVYSKLVKYVNVDTKLK